MTALLHSINPSTGERLRSFALLTEEGLRERIGLAAEAAAAHAAVPLEHRTRCLRKLAQLFAEEQDELVRSLALETGKTIRSAAAEVTRCHDACCHYAEFGARMLAPEILQAGLTAEAAGRTPQSYIAWNPVGVLLAVTPWESPLWQACRFALPAITAGNAVLLKPASSVSQCAVLLETLVRRAGFVRGTLSALLMDDRLVETALHDSRVAAVIVAGSESVGRALGAQAGWLLKRSTLQVVATGATLVMPSADLDGALAAAVGAVSSGTEAGKRLILHTSIYSDFVRRLVQAVETLHVGDPLKQETEVGPLGTRDALQALSDLVDSAVKAGGRVLTGGARLVGGGHFFEPTLLSDVPHDAPMAQDVLTGPVAMIFRARDVTDAIGIANSAPFSGDASVWTRVPREQQQLIADVTGDSVTLNAAPWQDAPGGEGPAGHHPQPGMGALREFTQARIVRLR